MNSFGYGNGGLGGASIIKGSVPLFADLPTPLSTYIGQLWFVETGSGGLFSALGSYKYPKGLYSPNVAQTDWELVPINVKVSEDTTTLINITNWSEFIGYVTDISISDRVIYSDVMYKNLTGSIGTEPDTDLVNWQAIPSMGTDPIQLKAISKVDQTISTLAEGTVIEAEIVQASNGVLLSAGNIIFNKAGFFRAQLQLNFENQNNTEIDTWAEYWNGTSWEILDDSGAVVDTSTANEGNVSFESTFTVPSGFQLRFKARVISGSAILNYDTTDNGTGVPSATFIVYEIDPIVQGIIVEPNNLTEDFHIGKEANGNSTKFETDGTMEAIGEATCWDDLSGALVGSRIDTSLGRLDYDYFNGGIAFAANARYPEEPVSIPVQLKHALQYGAGAVFRPHFHWLQRQALLPNFLLAYKKINNGVLTTFETDFSNYIFLTPIGNVFTYLGDATPQITKFPEIDISDMNISGQISFVLFRDFNNNSGLFAGSDPVSDPVTVTYQDSHAKHNMFGSRQEFIK